jgi:hypothetical protein
MKFHNSIKLLQQQAQLATCRAAAAVSHILVHNSTVLVHSNSNSNTSASDLSTAAGRRCYFPHADDLVLP